MAALPDRGLAEAKLRAQDLRLGMESWQHNVGLCRRDLEGAAAARRITPRAGLSGGMDC